MTSDAPRRGPGRPRKSESNLDKVAELAAGLGLGIKQSIEVVDEVKGIARVTLEVYEHWTITPTGKRKLVRRTHVRHLP